MCCFLSFAAQYQVEVLKEQLQAARAQAEDAGEGAKQQAHDLRTRAQQAEHRLHEVGKWTRVHGDA